MWDRKMQDEKCRVENTGPENAELKMQDLENAGPGIQIMSSTSAQT